MLICGVDEAGCGCLAGVVVAAAVIIGDNSIDGLRDSKQLTPLAREKLAPIIRDDCLAYAVGVADVNEIDCYNIRQATFFAMQRAVSGIVICPDKVLVDGNSLPDLPYPAAAVVGGDRTIEEIMAASILAKVYRDKEMRELDKTYPQYGFARHKGYPTREHLNALRQHGITPQHRRTFAPVRQLLPSDVSSRQ